MIVLGIDPGTTRPGFGVIELIGTQIKALDYGLLEKESILKSLELKDQLLKMYLAAHKLIGQYSPDVIGLEGLFFNKNVKTAFSTSSARAIIMLCCAEHQIPLLEPTPLQVKKGLTGTATSNKEQVAFMVTKILGLKNAPKPDDVTDALAVAITSGYSFQTQNKLIQH